MRLFTIFTLLILVVPGLLSQSRDQLYHDYIEKYHRIATAQQVSHGIPASIILAQGLLESGAGRGRLATDANNHFGIKCHDWTGKKIFHDDDERNECFRRYDHPRESFEDHSIFLTSRSRYRSLFLLPSDDYKGWAHGLKAAGYATDPNYAHKLIDLIERYQLYRYDKHFIAENTTVISAGPHIQQTIATERQLFKSNGVKMIVAQAGDTFTTLAASLNIREDRLRYYNDAPEHATLRPGTIVYLAKKKKKGSRSYPVHVVQEGETLYGISQNYGIQLISLYKMNELSFDKGAVIGQVLKLR